jgi:hypothetical protein
VQPVLFDDPQFRYETQCALGHTDRGGAHTGGVLVTALFLHGNPYDPRIGHSYERSVACFRRAAPLLTQPAELVQIPFEGGELHGPQLDMARPGNPSSRATPNGVHARQPQGLSRRMEACRLLLSAPPAGESPQLAGPPTPICSSLSLPPGALLSRWHVRRPCARRA